MKQPKPPTFVEFCSRINAPLTIVQEVLAAVCFDGEDVPIEMAAAFKGFSGSVPASARRLIALLAGRGSGKSRLAALYVLYRCLYADLKGLARGEMAFGLVISPTLELSEQILRFARGALAGTRYEKSIVAETASAFTIKRPDGASVRFTTAAASRGGRSGRGKSIVAAALDECCFFLPESHGAVNDADIYRALPARLLPGGAIVLASTPWSQTGLMFDLWSKEWGAPKTGLVAVVTTEQMRDDPNTLEMVRIERERDPDTAAREFDCEWLPHGGGNAFDLASLGRALCDSDLIAPASAGERIAVGGDLAMVSDRSAFVAVRARDGLLEVVDLVELKPGKSRALELDMIVAEAAEIVSRTHAAHEVRVDHHILEAARQSAMRQGLPVYFEPCSESPIDRELRFTRVIDAFKAGRIRVPKRFGFLTDQLSTIAATPRDGGGWKFGAPRRGGSHADAASAFLLACEVLIGGAQLPSAEALDRATIALSSVGDSLSHEFGGPDTGTPLIRDAEDRLNEAYAAAMDQRYNAHGIPVPRDEEEDGPAGDVAAQMRTVGALLGAGAEPAPARAPWPPPRTGIL
jgi:hypothetical protein